MNRLDRLEAHSIYILREAYKQAQPLAMLWSIGKDSAEIIAELETTRTPERAGRLMDSESEDSFERLRTSGYM